MPQLPDDLRRKKLEQVLYSIFDVETTGYAQSELHGWEEGHRVTEFGGQLVSGRRVESEMSQLFNPERDIPEIVQKKTGITPEETSRAPKFSDVSSQIKDFVRSGVAVAHNAPFDLTYVFGELRKAGVDVGSEAVPYIDTFKLAQKIYGKQGKGFYKLGNLAQRMGIDVGTTHRALADVDLTRQVLDKLLGELKKKNVTTLGQLEEMGGMSFYQPQRQENEAEFARWSNYRALGPTSPSTGQARANIIINDMKGMDEARARRHLQSVGIPDNIIQNYIDAAKQQGYIYGQGVTPPGRVVSSSVQTGRPGIGAELPRDAASRTDRIVNILSGTPEKHREEIFTDQTQRLAPRDAYMMRQLIFQKRPDLAAGLISPTVKAQPATVTVTQPTQPQGDEEDNYVPSPPPNLTDEDRDADVVNSIPATVSAPAQQYRSDVYDKPGNVTIDKPRVDMGWDFLDDLRHIRYQGQRIAVDTRIKPIEGSGGTAIQAEFTANKRKFSKRIAMVPGGFEVDNRLIQYQQIGPYSAGRGVGPQKQLIKALTSALTYVQGADVSTFTTDEDLQRVGQRAFSEYTGKFPGLPRNWTSELQTDMGGEKGATWHKWSPQFMARMFTGTQIRTRPDERRSAGEFPFYKFADQETHVSRGSETSAIDIAKRGRWMAWPVKAFRASSEMFTVSGSSGRPGVRGEEKYIAGFDAGKAAKRLQIGAQEMYPLMGRQIVESPFQLPDVPIPGRKQTFTPPRERGQVVRAGVLLSGMLPEGMGQVDLPDTMEERFKTVMTPSGEGGGLPRLGKIGRLAGRYSKLLLGGGPQGQEINFNTGDWDQSRLIDQYIDQSVEGKPALVNRILQTIRTGDNTTAFKSQGMKALEVGGTLPGQIGVEALYPAYKNPVGFAHGVLAGFANGTPEEQAMFAAMQKKYGFSDQWGDADWWERGEAARKYAMSGKGDKASETWADIEQKFGIAGGRKNYQKIMDAAQEIVSENTVMAPYRMSIHESLLEAYGLEERDGRLVPIRGGDWEFKKGERITKADLAQVGLENFAAPETKAGLLMSKKRQNVPGGAGQVWDVMRVAPTFIGSMFRQGRREHQGRQPFLGSEELEHISQFLSPDFAQQLRREGMKTTRPRAELWQTFESMPWKGNADRFDSAVGIKEKDIWSIAAADKELLNKEIDPNRRRLRALQKVFGDQTIRLQMPNKRFTVDLPSPNTVDAFSALNELGEQKNPLANSYVDLINAATQGSRQDFGKAFKRYYGKMNEMVGSQEFQRKLAGAAPRFAYEGAMGSDVALAPRQVMYSDAALARLAGLQMEDGSFDPKELKSFKQYVMDRANSGDPLLTLTFRRPTSHGETQFGSAVTEILTQEMGAQLGATARGATVMSPYLAGAGKGDFDSDRYMSLLLNQGRVGYWRGGQGSWDVTRRETPDQEWVDIKARDIERPSYLDEMDEDIGSAAGIMGARLPKLKGFVERVPAVKFGARAVKGWHQETMERFAPDKWRTGWWEIDTPDWARKNFAKDLPRELARHFREVGGAEEEGVYGKDTPWWNEMEKWRKENQDYSRFAKVKEKGSWSSTRKGGALHELTAKQIQQSYVNEMLNKTITMTAPYNMGRAMGMQGVEKEALGAFTAVAYQFGLDKALGQQEGQGPEGLKEILSMWQSFTPYGGRKREGSYAELFDEYQIKQRDRFGNPTERPGPQWRGQMYGGPAGLATEVMESMAKLANEKMPNSNAAPMRAKHVAQLLFGSATQEQIDAVKSGRGELMVAAAGDNPMDVYRKPTVLRAIAARRAAAADRSRGWAPPQGNTWQPIWDDLVAEGRRTNQATRLVSRSYGVPSSDLPGAFQTYGSMPGGPDWLAQDVLGLSGMQGYGPIEYNPDDIMVSGHGGVADDPSDPNKLMLRYVKSKQITLDELTSQGLLGMVSRMQNLFGAGLGGMTQEEIGKAGASKNIPESTLAQLKHVVQQFQALPQTWQEPPQKQKQQTPTTPVQPTMTLTPQTPQPVSQGNVQQAAAMTQGDIQSLMKMVAEVAGKSAGEATVEGFKTWQADVKRSNQEFQGIKSSQQEPDQMKRGYFSGALKDLYTQRWATPESVASGADVGEFVSSTAYNQLESMAREFGGSRLGLELEEIPATLSTSRLQAHSRNVVRLSSFAQKRNWQAAMPQEHRRYRNALEAEMVKRQLSMPVEEDFAGRTDKQIANEELLQGVLSGSGGKVGIRGQIALSAGGLGTLGNKLVDFQAGSRVGVRGMSDRQLAGYRGTAISLAGDWERQTGQAAPFGAREAAAADREMGKRERHAANLIEGGASYLSKEFGLTADEAKKARTLLSKMSDPRVADKIGTELPRALAGLADQAKQQQALFEKHGGWAKEQLAQSGAAVVKDLRGQIDRRTIGPGGMRQLGAIQQMMTMATEPGMKGPTGIGISADAVDKLSEDAQRSLLSQELTGGTTGGRVRTAAQGLLSEFSIGGTAFRMMAVNRLLGQPAQRWMGQAGQYASAQAGFAVAMGGGADAIMSTPLGQLQAHQARISDLQTGMGEAALMSRAGLASMFSDLAGGGGSLQAGRALGRVAVPAMGAAEWALKGGMIASAIGSVGGMLGSGSALGGIMTGIGTAAGPIALGAGAIAGGGLALGEAYQMSGQQNVYREMMEAGLGYRKSPISFGTKVGLGIRSLMAGSTAAVEEEYFKGAQAFSQSSAFKIAEATVHVENMEIPGLDATQKMSLAGALEFAGVKPGDFSPGGRGEALLRDYAPIEMIGGTERMVQTAIQAGGAMGISPGSGLMPLYEALKTKPELQTQVGQYNLVTASQIIGNPMGQLGMMMGPEQIRQMEDEIIPRLERGESSAKIAEDYKSRYGVTDLSGQLGFTGGSISADRVASVLGEGADPSWKAQVTRTTQELYQSGVPSAYGWDIETTIRYAEGLQQERDDTGILGSEQMKREGIQAGTVATGGYARGGARQQAANRGAPSDFVGSQQWEQAQGVAATITRTMGLSPEEMNYFTQNAYEQIQAGALPETLMLGAQRYIGQDPGQTAFGVMSGFATGEGAMPYASQQQATQRASLAGLAASKMGYSAMLGGMGGKAAMAMHQSRVMEGMPSVVGAGAQPLMSIDEATGGIYNLNQLEQRELAWDSMLAGQAFQMTGMQGRLGQQRQDLASFYKTSALQRRQMDLQNRGRMLGLQQALESENLQYAQGMERARVGFRQGTERLETGFRQGTQRLDTGFRQQQESMALQRQMWDVQTGFQRQQMGVQWQGMMQQRQWGREDMAYNQMTQQRAYGWQQEDLDRSIRFATGRDKEQLIRQQERSEETFATDTSRRETEEGRQETLWQQEEAQFKAQATHFENIKQLETAQFEMQKAHMLENYTMSQAHMTENYEMQKAHMKENFEMSVRHLNESHAMRVRHIQEQMALGEEQQALANEIFEQNKTDQERRLKYAISESERTIDYYQNTVFPNQREQKRLQDEIEDAYAQFLRQQWDDLTAGGRVWNATEDMFDQWVKRANELKNILNSISSGDGGGGKPKPPHPDPEHPEKWRFDEATWSWVPAGSNATGGDLFPGDVSWVGEQGPELITAAVPTRVIPNYLSMAAAAAGSVSQGNGVSVTIGNLNINLEGVTGDAREIATAIFAEFEGAVNDVARNQALRGDIWRT